MRKVFAGIYKVKDMERTEDGAFAILYNNSLCFIFNGISDIFQEVEHGIASDMEFVDGYSLAVITKDNKWQIRDSGRKHTPEYVIAEGTYIGNFEQSLERFKKVLS
jgi:hypothetical protein